MLFNQCKVPQNARFLVCLALLTFAVCYDENSCTIGT
jgi:hypothetical protein